jgi:hypothetical protein
MAEISVVAKITNNGPEYRTAESKNALRTKVELIIASFIPRQLFQTAQLERIFRSHQSERFGYKPRKMGEYLKTTTENCSFLGKLKLNCEREDRCSL